MLWLFLVLALIAAGIIALVLFRHWKEIRLLDPETIRAEQERKVRDRIVRQRFDRKLRHFLVPMQRASRALGGRLTQTYRQVEERLAHAARLPARQEAGGDMSEPSDSVRALLAEAAQHERAGRFAEAERAYLEILRHDDRQFQAYRGLGALYMTQRQYPQAREIFLFLDRLQGCDDTCYASLADIAESQGDTGQVEAMRKRAVEANSRNAARHAELAGFYLSHGSPDYALASARRAADLDPETPRMLELCVEAAILVPDRAEAERRYQRLTSLTNDRRVLLALKDKIDAMPAK
jgi:tetratricopeptide (TPR) repeat protein